MSKAMTREEKAYVSRAIALGCALCRHLGLGESPGEWHHARTGVGAGKRGPHKRGFPLCPPHHRTSNDALHVCGRRAWERRFGVTEMQFVEQTERLIEV